MFGTVGILLTINPCSVCADCPPSILVSKANWLIEFAELPLLPTAGVLVVIAGVKAVSVLPITLTPLIENVGRYWGMQTVMLPKRAPVLLSWEVQ